tara:strand:- start:108 stop:485 length:378 start_codon:yes stop_codon:yes gene_type:complete
MTRFKVIYFIYDADSGILNEIKYWINKNMLKKNNACELCDISHGKFFVKFEWLKFVEELKTKYQVKVLHRNELPIYVQEKNFQLPCVIGESDQGLKEIIKKTEFKDLENLNSIEELRAKFFKQIL